MTVKDKKPEIRFDGFNDVWEQRELGDYLETSWEKNVDDVYSKQDVLSVSGDYGIVNQIEFQGRSFAGASVSNYGIVHTGDIVYTKSPLRANPFGIIKINKGNTGIVSTLYAVYHPKENTFPDFVQVYFEQNARLNNYLHPLISKGAKNDMKVTADNALKGVVNFPKYNEQKMISEFFTHLDKLIALRQRKYDKLVVIKNSMLERMFPKAGANVPEIRFTGFTYAWVQHKLGTIAEFNPKAELPETFEYVDLESVVGIEMIAHREEKKDTAPSRAQRLARQGDLFYQTVRPYQKNNYLFEESCNNYVFSTGYAQMRPYGDGYFLLSLVQNNLFVKSILDRCTGTSYPAINSNELADTEVFIPLNNNEQAQIGAFFKNIDKVITLHQRELEKLKIIKKSMLEKMFV